MPDPGWLNRSKLPEFIAVIDDWLDDAHSGMTKAQREVLTLALDALLDLRDQKLVYSVPVDMGSLRGSVDSAQCLEVVRAAVRDRQLDAKHVLQTIVPFIPTHTEQKDEVESLKDHIVDLANENESLDRELKRYEQLADALEQAVTAWKNTR